MHREMGEGQTKCLTALTFKPVFHDLITIYTSIIYIVEFKHITILPWRMATSTLTHIHTHIAGRGVV